WLAIPAPSVVTMSVLRRLVGFTFKVLSFDGCWDVWQRQYPTQESPFLYPSGRVAACLTETSRLTADLAQCGTRVQTALEAHGLLYAVPGCVCEGCLADRPALALLNTTQARQVREYLEDADLRASSFAQCGDVVG